MLFMVCTPLLDDGLMTSTFDDYLCDDDIIIYFSGACCVMFQLLSFIPIVLVSLSLQLSRYNEKG
jgi:hypothetical protein